jgi:hypothetical protein
LDFHFSVSLSISNQSDAASILQGRLSYPPYSGCKHFDPNPSSDLESPIKCRVVERERVPVVERKRVRVRMWKMSGEFSSPAYRQKLTKDDWFSMVLVKVEFTEASCSMSAHCRRLRIAFHHDDFSGAIGTTGSILCRDLDISVTIRETAPNILDTLRLGLLQTGRGSQTRRKKQLVNASLACAGSLGRSRGSARRSLGRGVVRQMQACRRAGSQPKTGFTQRWCRAGAWDVRKEPHIVASTESWS